MCKISRLIKAIMDASVFLKCDNVWSAVKLQGVDKNTVQ